MTASLLYLVLLSFVLVEGQESFTGTAYRADPGVHRFGAGQHALYRSREYVVAQSCQHAASRVRHRPAPRERRRMPHNERVKIFISSVRSGLELERDALPGLIRALGHEPVRFEDFSAQAVPSRQARIEAVESSDAYLLLLGPHYGTTFPETRFQPRRRGQGSQRSGRSCRIHLWKLNSLRQWPSETVSLTNTSDNGRTSGWASRPTFA
jgi:hypothetical protein